MYARNAHFRIKSLSMAAEFAQIIEKQVVPVLREQKGFKGEITLSNPGSLEQIAISLWDSKANADAYDANGYSRVLKALGRVIDGIPKIRTYEIVTLNLDHDTVAVPYPTKYDQPSAFSSS